MDSTQLALNQKNEKVRDFLSVEDYEREAGRHLRSDLRDYIHQGAESEATLRRNIEAFSSYQLRRRVLQGIEHVNTEISYFGGRIKSELPFFPSCINTGQLYPKAILDVLAVSKSYCVPIFVSEFAVRSPLEFSKLPSLVRKEVPLFWQIYLQKNKVDQSLKQARTAGKFGYGGVVVTVDAELNVKLRNSVPEKLLSQDFLSVVPTHIKQLRSSTSLPLVVKGVMTAEDAILAIECGADGVVVSNHGGRVLDHGQATIELLPGIVRVLRARKSTRRAEIFFDGGIRRGTDILIALALGARGCLLGRPIFWALATDRKKGVENLMKILESELIRAALLCGVDDLAKVKRDTVVEG